jgi:hypothetical protein
VGLQVPFGHGGVLRVSNRLWVAPWRWREAQEGLESGRFRAENLYLELPRKELCFAALEGKNRAR